MIRSLQIATFTNTGQYRRRNEDSLLVGGQVLAGLSMATPQSFFFDSVPVLLAVADGIGGSIAGDVASREVMQQLAIPPCPDGKHALYERISSLKTFLDHLVRKNPGLFGMGTTLAGVLCKSDELIIFSCGDSRVYLALPERETLQLMTRDHSMIQEMIEAGTLTEKEARSHPLGHVITSCLSGGKSHNAPDIRISAAHPLHGSRLVICTDGVWDYGGEQFIRAACSGSPLSAAQMILDACNDAGAPDNLTLIIADIST